MRTESKRAFRPRLERVEARVVATVGVVSAAAHHAAAHPAAHVEAHHPSPPPKHHPAATAHHAQSQGGATQSGATHSSTSATAPQPTAPPPTSSLPTNTTTNQAWVEIVNTTGETLEYYIKLAPYDNGQFIPFDIAPGQTQYQMSSLISNGQRVKADFAIQFGNGPITPLNTGVSEASAQGYYIFLDSNLAPYVAPFVNY